MKVFAYDIVNKKAFFPILTQQLGGSNTTLEWKGKRYTVSSIILRPNHKLHVVEVIPL